MKSPATRDVKPAELDEEQDITLPPLKQGEKVRLIDITPRQHFTEPPPRYTEASLVKMLEEKGIGRPSTYATILSTIQDREYVTKDQGKFRPTELGTVVTDMLVKHFEDIFDVQYTARMEEELDEVEEGKMTWVEALDEFYKKFEKDLNASLEEHGEPEETGNPNRRGLRKMRQPDGHQMGPVRPVHGLLGLSGMQEHERNYNRRSGEGRRELGRARNPKPCENCGKPMALKRGRFGQFLACTGYPECKTTRKIVAGSKTPKKPDVVLDETCPQCGQAKLC